MGTQGRPARVVPCGALFVYTTPKQSIAIEDGKAMGLKFVCMTRMDDLGMIGGDDGVKQV
jgi:hypothetical protein